MLIFHFGKSVLAAYDESMNCLNAVSFCEIKPDMTLKEILVT